MGVSDEYGEESDFTKYFGEYQEQIQECRLSGGQERKPHTTQTRFYNYRKNKPDEFGTQLNNSPEYFVGSFLKYALNDQYAKWVHVEVLPGGIEKPDQEPQWCKVSKRGNPAHAFKLQKRIDKVINKLQNCIINTPVNKPGFRPGTVFKTKVLFLTRTSRTDKSASPLTRYEAWTEESKAKNNFRAAARKKYGGFSMLSSPESRFDGYPAPHDMVFLDNPVEVKRHTSKSGKVTYRLMNYELKQDLGRLYPLGHVDVQGIVQDKRDPKKWEVSIDGKKVSPLKYMLKYEAKGIRPIMPESFEAGLLTANRDTFNEWFNGWWEELQEGAQGGDTKARETITHLYTLSMNWLFRKHTMPISKELQERLTSTAPDSKEECGVKTGVSQQGQLDSGGGGPAPWDGPRIIPVNLHNPVKWKLELIAGSLQCYLCFRSEGAPPPFSCRMRAEAYCHRRRDNAS